MWNKLSKNENFFLAVAEEPEFTDVILNQTVAAGRPAKFACSVKNLGSFKVSIKFIVRQIDFSFSSIFNLITEIYSANIKTV